MDISKFIQSAVAGDALQAREAINDILSSRAFEAIDGRKKELSQTIFGGKPEEVEVQDTADTEIEEDELLTQEEFESLSEEDQELYLEALDQLDEISIETMKSAKEKLGNKAFNAHYDDNKRMAQQYAQRAMSMKSRIAKKQRQMDSQKTNEEVEELDELSKSTLGSYVKKRTKQLPQIEVGYQMAEPGRELKGYEKLKKKVNKGIGRAVDRLTK